jgi:ABC-type transport system involved in multi-copper enzyme maturation permease subunit
MIVALSSREFAKRRIYIAVGVFIVCVVTAIMPFFYLLSLNGAEHARNVNDVVLNVKHDFGTYRTFIDKTWLGTAFVELLFALALVGGAPAIAGERDARTWPLLYLTGADRGMIVAIKFLFVAGGLALATIASAGVISAVSAVRNLQFTPDHVAIALAVSWCNAMAFLALCFATSAWSKRPIVAGATAVGIGFAFVGIFFIAKFNAMALASSIFAANGAILWGQVTFAVAFSVIFTTAGLAVTYAGLESRRAV